MMSVKLWWPKTIRAQLLCGFSTILLLGFVSSAIGYTSLQRLRYSSRTTLEQTARVRELSLELHNNFLQARQAEEAYLNRWKILETPQGLIRSNQQYLDQARENLAVIEQLEGNSSILADDLALLESLFLNYDSAFQATVDRIATSKPDRMFHQRLQNLVEDIEADTTPLENSEVQILLWMIATKEQAYFNTGNQQDLTDVRTSLDRLAYQLEALPASPKTAELESLIQDYVDNLNAVLLLDQQVRVNTIVANNITQEIERIIQIIGDITQSRSHAARIQLAKTANQSIMALLITALTALGLTIWASLWLGRRILVPITALHLAAERVSRGDLEFTLALAGSDEFSVVADTFNQMVGQLRQTLTDLEQRVLERTNALSATNQSLKEKTRSLEIALQQLQESETNYRSLIEHLHAGVIVYDRDTVIVMCNQMACRLLNVSVEEMIGLNAIATDWPLVDELGHPLAIEHYPVNQVLATSEPLHNYVLGIQSTTDCAFIWVLINAFPSFDNEGDLHRVVVTFTNISDRKLAEEELRQQALHDTLTGLPNRTLLLERLDHAIQYTQRQPDRLFAVLFIDLNRFKVVNDSLGHMIGDQLLVKVADLLMSHVRSVDTVARLGGDEFVILLEQITHPVEAIQVVERIQADLKIPIALTGYTVFTSASIGIALSNPTYQNGQEVLRDADNAMYRAKAKGQSCYEIFDPGMHQNAIQLLEMETSLRQAIARQEFVLEYQPIVNLETRQLLGFEALVRWQHPERGRIAPSEFIPLAEETGLIIPLSEWILQEACQHFSQWRATLPQAHSLKMNVNVAAGLFKDADFFAKLDRTLTQANLPPQNLNLEVTESVLLEHVEGVMSTLLKLQSRQIEISLDDFGTGYSSLSYLKKFPINTLKIDKSFVDSLERDNDSSIVEAIIQIAQSLGMTVVAEGVETADQADWLQKLGCAAIQGYLIAAPLSAEQAQQFISTYCNRALDTHSES